MIEVATRPLMEPNTCSITLEATLLAARVASHDHGWVVGHLHVVGVLSGLGGVLSGVGVEFIKPIGAVHHVVANVIPGDHCCLVIQTLKKGHTEASLTRM